MHCFFEKVFLVLLYYVFPGTRAISLKDIPSVSKLTGASRKDQDIIL